MKEKKQESIRGQAPIFADKSPKRSKIKRKVLGIVCSIISLAVLFGVCEIMEQFKESAINEAIRRGTYKTKAQLKKEAEKRKSYPKRRKKKKNTTKKKKAKPKAKTSKSTATEKK